MQYWIIEWAIESWVEVFFKSVFKKDRRNKNAFEKASDFQNHSYCGEVK